MFGATCLLFGVVTAELATHKDLNLNKSYAGLLVPFVSSAQGRSSISGYILNESRRPVERVRVELLDEVDTLIATTLANGSGLYSFHGLSSGSFQIRVLTHGTDYVSQTERVMITSITRGGADSVQVNFTLKVKAAKSSMISAGGTVFVQDVPDTARKAYVEAMKDLANINRAEAGIENLKKAIGIFPTYYEALESLGTEYVKRRQYEPARAVLTKAVEINPRGYASLYGLGIAQYNLKQPETAADSLRSAVAITPASVNSHLWLGIVLLKSGKPEQAETHLRQAYKLGGKRIPDVHMYLAQLYSNSKRYKEAADELELFLREAPNARDAESIKKVIARLRTQAK